MGGKWIARLVASVLLVSTAAAAHEPVAICLTPAGAAPEPDQRFIRLQLAAWGKALSTPLVFDCRSPLRVTVRLAAAPSRPHPPEALGATRVANGQLQPDITVFCDVVRSLFPFSVGPQLEARALARVIAHELAHLLDGRTGHVADGLNDEAFTARRMLEPPPARLLAERE